MGPRAARLQRIWYGGERVPLLLQALVPVYRGLRGLSLLPYRFGWRQPQRLPVPVLVVGNLTAGGAGKTPLVIALIEGLRARGFRPGVVSRGYGGLAHGPLLLGERPDPALVGDEPALIRRRTDAPVAIGRDRPVAAALLVQAGVDVILADDGLQNPALARDVEVCVIDGVRRFGNQRLLPAGPLREALDRLQSIDLKVCNGGLAAPGEVPMQLHGGIAVNLGAGMASQPLSAFAGQRVHAIAGIGNPERFFSGLRERGIEVIAHPLPDHHAPTAQDLDFGDDLPVLMTEKDAIKCEALATPRHWCVPVSAGLPPAFFDEVAARLRSVAR